MNTVQTAKTGGARELSIEVNVGTIKISILRVNKLIRCYNDSDYEKNNTIRASMSPDIATVHCSAHPTRCSARVRRVHD